MSTFDATVSLLETLPESDLIAVQGIVKALAARRREESLFSAMSESDLLDALEAGREDIRLGRCKSARESVSELRELYGL